MRAQNALHPRRNPRLRWVFRRDEIQRHFRIARIVWERGVPGLPGGGYSAKLSIALTPRLFLWERDEGHVWLLVLFGLRVGYTRSYGGIFP
jgi:hypothetical protein